MPVQIDAYSRLNYSQLMKGSNGTREVEWWDLPFIRRIKPAPDDIIYTVTTHDRIDKLAYKYLGSPIFWDVIAETNGMRLLPMALRFGDKIRIPSQVRTVTSIRTRQEQ